MGCCVCDIRKKKEKGKGKKISLGNLVEADAGVDSENADRVLIILLLGSGTNRGRAYPDGSECGWGSR